MRTKRRKHQLNCPCGWHRFLDRLVRKLAWQLPHRLVMWASLRMIAHATTGKFSTTIVPDLPAMEAVNRWDSPYGGDKYFGNRP